MYYEITTFRVVKGLSIPNIFFTNDKKEFVKKLKVELKKEQDIQVRVKK